MPCGEMVAAMPTMVPGLAPDDDAVVAEQHGFDLMFEGDDHDHQFARRGDRGR